MPLQHVRAQAEEEAVVIDPEDGDRSDGGQRAQRQGAAAVATVDVTPCLARVFVELLRELAVRTVDVLAHGYPLVRSFAHPPP